MPYSASANCKKINVKFSFNPVLYSSTCVEAYMYKKKMYNQKFVSPISEVCNNPPSCNDIPRKNY